MGALTAGRECGLKTAIERRDARADHRSGHRPRDATSNCSPRARCSAAAATSSAAPPNTQRLPGVSRLPGRLPVANAKAVEYLCKAGIAFGCGVPALLEVRSQKLLLSRHAQELSDLAVRHAADARRRRAILLPAAQAPYRLTRIHLEEDTGEIDARGRRRRAIAGSAYTLVDFNRAGVPLMEIVRSRRSARPKKPKLLEALKRTFVVDRRVRRQDARRLAALRRQRLDPPAREAPTRRQSRDQEYELVPIGLPCDRIRDRAPDRECSRGRAHRARDARLG